MFSAKMCRYLPMSKEEYRVALLNYEYILKETYGNPESPEVHEQLKFIRKELRKL
jgi:hypothetical protein